jgi:hypothetical protein
VETFDVKQFWAMKWEKIIANIRHDYELLYASTHCETVTYYENKMEEAQFQVERVKLERTKYYQETEMKRLEIVQRMLRLEHEEAQKMHVYEKELRIKLEAMYCK